MRRRRAHSQIMEPIGEHQEEDGTYTPRDFADWREIPSEALERKEIRQSWRGRRGSGGESTARCLFSATFST